MATSVTGQIPISTHPVSGVHQARTKMVTTWFGGPKEMVMPGFEPGVPKGCYWVVPSTLHDHVA